jgi:hypothetical protein
MPQQNYQAQITIKEEKVISENFQNNLNNQQQQQSFYYSTNEKMKYEERINPNSFNVKMLPPISQNLDNNNNINNTNKNKTSYFNVNDINNNNNNNNNANNEEENSNDWILDMFDNDKNDKGLIFNNNDYKNSGEN